MMKSVFVAGLAVANGALVLNRPSAFVQTKTENMVSAHERMMNRMTEEAMAHMEKYVVDDDDQDEDLIGEHGLEDSIMEDKATLSQHDFTEIHDEDPVEPEAYAGEDTAAIDADDENTNFGEDADDQDE